MNATRNDPVDRARRTVAAKLTRPFSDIDALATEILDALLTDGWRPPEPPEPAPRRPANPVSETQRRAHIAAIREWLTRRDHDHSEPA